MLFRCSKWVVVIGLILATGGHWAVLQSVAWVRMTVQYSKTDSVTVALEMTFNGKNPCGLCKAVQEGRQAEKQHSIFKIDTRLDLLCSAERISIRVPLVRPLIVFSAGAPLPPCEAPPVPPPRFA